MEDSNMLNKIANIQMGDNTSPFAPNKKAPVDKYSAKSETEPKESSVTEKSSSVSRSFVDKSSSYQMSDESDKDNKETLQTSSNSNISSVSVGQSQTASSSSIGTEASHASSVADVQTRKSNSVFLSSSEAVAKEKRDAFGTSLDDFYDNHPEWSMNRATEEIGEYISLAKNASDYSDVASFEKRMMMLKRSQKNIALAFNQLLTDYNHSTLVLSQQIKALKDEQGLMKKVKPNKEMRVIARWARTGIPSRIEQIYQRLAEVADDPRFKEFLNNNDLNKQVRAPQSVVNQHSAFKSELDSKAKSLDSASDKSKSKSSSSSEQ